MPLKYTLQAALTIIAALVLGLTAWLTQTEHWQLQDDPRYVCYFAVAWIATRLRVRSRVTGDTCSMGFVFVLISLVELNTIETVLIACCAILLDGLMRRYSEAVLLETSASLISTVFAAVVAQWFYHLPILSALHIEWPVRFVAASLLCFAAGITPLVMVSMGTARITMASVRQSMHILTFPYYVLAATATAIYAAVEPFTEWYATALLVPMLVLLHRSLRQFADKLDRYREKTKCTSALQERTIEVLALAIEKDQITPHHLRRMQIYAEGIGRAVGLSRLELDALKAAAVMHDVGKLAVPDHITSKPGKFTDEEFDKMKIHTLIGAGIIDQARFPYPVTPIVRSHHERWDGTGYPDGLKGEDIPVGARILAIVDTLDALMTPRSYRPAVNLEVAVDQIVKHSGTLFDPKLVGILQRRYKALEKKCERTEPLVLLSEPNTYLQTIGAARSEMSALFHLHEQLSRSLTVSDVGHLLRTSVRDLLPYDALAVYFHDAADAKPDIVCGDRSMTRRRKPMMTMPLPFAASPAGRVAIYCLLGDRCTPEQIRAFRGLLPRIGQAIENGRKFQATSTSASTDYLTRLPNMASLSQRLRDDIESAAKNRTEVVLLICDLDGFKGVNDTMGHLTGNRVLVEVAQSLSQNTRGADYVARMGGDEFVLILPGSAGNSLPERIASLRALVREAGRRATNADLIDASFGAAIYPRDGGDAEELVAVADQRMYDDKMARKKGRTVTPAPLSTALPAGPVM